VDRLGSSTMEGAEYMTASTKPVTLTPRRLEELCDGVFAIAMTILVLNIAVPVADKVPANRLASALWQLAPQANVYVITFVNLGVLWVGQQNQSHLIGHVDRWFVWMNIGFLLLISLLPLSTALLGQYPLQHVALVVYGANLIAATLMLGLHWQYATSKNRLLRAPLPRSIVRLAHRRTLATAAAYSCALLLSFVLPIGALILYLVIPLISILPSRIDKHFAAGPNDELGEG
jgi:uncharacterized membrane protein